MHEQVQLINCIRKISIYELPSHLYLVGTDTNEHRFRILKINRHPVPLNENCFDTFKLDDINSLFENETIMDRLWRLSMTVDQHIYTKPEINRFLRTLYDRIQIENSNKNSDKLTISKLSAGLRFLFLKKRPKLALPSGKSSPLPCTNMELGRISQSSCSSELDKQMLPVPTDCYGLIGIVRFLYGYYLIIITKCSVVAQIGEHLIYKVDDTAMIYIPGNCNNNNLSYTTSPKSSNSFIPSEELEIMQDSSQNFEILTANSDNQSQSNLINLIKQSLNKNKLSSNEMRFVKLFRNVDLASNFYFSYTYDLSHSLQYNMEPLDNLPAPKVGRIWVTRSLPNNRFIWNWNLIPLEFRPDKQSVSDMEIFQPIWFTPLYHGSIGQTALASCGMPVLVTLIARRSRHFAGPRFLKRGTNMVGDVANEVETEQIVMETSHALLRQNRISSYVQLRGSVPLFWSQECGKVVVGKPPLEFLRDDPYFEAMGLHFSNLFERFGSPIIVLNLMKQREKRLFEISLSNGFENGIAYLSQFLPSSIKRSGHNSVNNNNNDNDDDDNNNNNNNNNHNDNSQNIITNEILSSPPIIYIAFDIARVQKFRSAHVFNYLTPIVENCVRRTGFHCYFPSHSSTTNFTGPKQYGLIRVNCVDCLDRTNTSQFLIGRVLLAHQLYALGFLTEPNYADDSRIDRLLQDLYDEHGDTLALQYGGSQLVHNIDTYRKTNKLTSQSRDLVQTISRYYSNKFSDWEKQCAISLFLRIYRPNLNPGNLFDLIQKISFSLHSAPCLPLSDSAVYSQEQQQQQQQRSPIPGPDRIAVLNRCIGSVAISNNGPIWELSSDSYLHWLDSCSRLPTQRNCCYTNWCSRSIIESLPIPLVLIRKRSDRNLAVELELPVDDIRVNWFDEYYQPLVYISLDRVPIMNIRLVELPVEMHFVQRTSYRKLQSRKASAHTSATKFSSDHNSFALKSNPPAFNITSSIPRSISCAARRSLSDVNSGPINYYISTINTTNTASCWAASTTASNSSAGTANSNVDSGVFLSTHNYSIPEEPNKSDQINWKIKQNLINSTPVHSNLTDESNSSSDSDSTDQFPETLSCLVIYPPNLPRSSDMFQADNSSTTTMMMNNHNHSHNKLIRRRDYAMQLGDKEIQMNNNHSSSFSGNHLQNLIKTHFIEPVLVVPPSGKITGTNTDHNCDDYFVCPDKTTYEIYSRGYTDEQLLATLSTTKSSVQDVVLSTSEKSIKIYNKYLDIDSIYNDGINMFDKSIYQDYCNYAVNRKLVCSR